MLGGEKIILASGAKMNLASGEIILGGAKIILASAKIIVPSEKGVQTTNAGSRMFRVKKVSRSRGPERPFRCLDVPAQTQLMFM